MLERSRRPLDDEDRRILEDYRRKAIGRAPLEHVWSLCGGTVGLFVAIVWLGFFHRGDRAAPFWLFALIIAIGAVLGAPLDYRQRRREQRERARAAAAVWDPVVAVGVVEHVVASGSKVARIDDRAGDTAWFIQAEDGRILCVWDWADEATERVEVDLIPGQPPTTIRISWSGAKVSPSLPRRKFKRGERPPEQCDVLAGVLDRLDDLLRARPSAVSRRKIAPRNPRSTRAASLARDVASLGFYKFIPEDQVSEAKAEIEQGAHEWYRSARRAFDADAERLAEGGVEDLLGDMRAELAREGWVLGDIDQTYDAQRGYTVRVGADSHALWREGEGKKAWELTTTRTATLINQALAKAGSAERVHVLAGGEDGVFVLLTPALRDAIARSGVFRDNEIPATT